MLLAHAHYKLDDFLLTTNTVSYVAIPQVGMPESADEPALV